MCRQGTACLSRLLAHCHWVLRPQSAPLFPFQRLKASDLQLRFCTNETQAAREKFVAKLQRLGFDILVSEVFSPAPAAVAVLQERGLRPHLLVSDGEDLLHVGSHDII